MYDKIYEMLEKITLYKKKKDGNTNRLGFPSHRGCVWGIIKPRFKSQPELSRYSRKYPEIHEEIVRIGKEICPFEFKTVQLNKNCQCPPHKDKANQSRSILVSFGDYTGGELVIEGVVQNAYHNPIEFDGVNNLHWNLEHTGTKYSLIYFS
jgi:hypothetical protein